MHVHYMLVLCVLSYLFVVPLLVIQASFNQVDRDGDGKLSYEEFQEIPVQTSRKFFDLVDSSKDSFITVSEVERVLNLPSMIDSK